MYAALTGITFLLLFSVVFWSTARFMRHQIDDSVSNEISEIVTDGQADEPEGLRLLVQGMARHPSGFYYLLQDSHGSVLAGNLPPTEARLGVREWTASTSQRRTPYSGIRGQGVNLSGNYLFVGWSTYQLHEMEEFVAKAFLWVLGASILLALTGGIMMSGRLMKKIENVSRTTRNIMEGNLQQRVAMQSGGDEFDHLALSINSMLDRIEMLMNDLRQVTTDIAHDLRTPLTRLRNRLELAQRSQLDQAGLRDIVNAACRDTDVILEIFGALLRIAQVESGARRAGFAVVELSEVIDTIVEVYRPSIEEKQQCLAEAIARNLLVVGDRELLTQLFANILENAILHSPPGAQLSVHADRDHERVQVTVTDNGPGIPEAMRSKVLGRFVRLDNSRTTHGSGLGLSLVAAIARLHNATMTLSGNEPGLRVCVSFEAATERG
jgi:signal transduction histidine kinase